jgi:alkylhydroperoxidase/carboxymuconolactone decarboxylase family protein YurZ
MEKLEIIDNGGRRQGTDTRQVSLSMKNRERRSFRERRSGIDRRRRPEINEGLTNLRQKCEEGTNLDVKTAILIKLAVAVSAGLENTVKAHAVKALKLGVAEDQIEEIILINLASIGYAKAVAALNWVREVTGKSPFQSNSSGKPLVSQFEYRR